MIAKNKGIDKADDLLSKNQHFFHELLVLRRKTADQAIG